MIKIIACIVFGLGILDTLVCITRSVAGKKTSDRTVNLLIGVPLGLIKTYLAWYVIFNT
ncbi:hypothetical protein [Clostridium intestinale]|uniref:Uncharacterized protein n=1 Tax=Clostridium intestinale TaxID=36845 RepID=A0A7D6ZTM9_9CLOT|nr:hypothetical protein [Clostridium intestinale]QLY82243.1 hypothetical protein HZF06_11835 [Clostridium intestinale]